MYYVYILLQKDNNLYHGFTDDIKRRRKEHDDGKVASTKHKRPLKCILVECYMEKSDALRREKFLKTTEGRRLLRQQLRDTLIFHKNNETL